jgi:hypothetical protein
MTQRQQSMYWAEWARLRDVLRSRGQSLAQVEEHRHELHRRALGVAKSSKAFTNSDLDKVLARIRAEIDPANLDAQLALQDSPDRRRERLEANLCRLAEACGIEGGPNGIAGYFKRFLNGRPMAALDERDLQKLAGILARRAKRLGASDGNPF